MLPSLIVVEGNQPGLALSLSNDVTTIGSDARCTIQVQDSLVSPCHCRIFRLPGERESEQNYLLKSMGRCPGPTVNGIDVEDNVLELGDIICVGTTKFEFNFCAPVMLLDYCDQESPIKEVHGSDETSFVELPVMAGHSLPEAERAPSAALPASGGQVEDVAFLYDVALLASRELNLRSMLHELLALTHRWLEANLSVAVLANEDVNDLSDRIVLRNDPQTASSRPAIWDQSVPQHVVDHRVGVLKRFPIDHSKDYPARSSFVTAVCVPVIGGGRLFGVVYVDLFTNGSREIGVTQLAMLIAAASQVGTALANRETTQAMQDRQRFASVGEIASAVSHRVNNILQVIHGGSYLIEMGLQNSDLSLVTKGWLIVKANQSRISRLTGNLLAYSRPFEPYPTQCRLGPLVDDAITSLNDSDDVSRITFDSLQEVATNTVRVDSFITARALENIFAVALAVSRNEDVSHDVMVRFEVQERDLEVVVSFRHVENGFQLAELLEWPVSKSKADWGMLELMVSQENAESQGGGLTVEVVDGVNTVRLLLPGYTEVATP